MKYCNVEVMNDYYKITKNSGRRQLSPLVLSYLRGKQYNEVKSSYGGSRGNQYTKMPSGKNVDLAKSSELMKTK